MQTGAARASAPSQMTATGTALEESMQIAIEPQAQIPEPSGIANARVWNVPRVASVFALGLIPVAALFLQLGTVGLMTATVIEVITAAVAFKVWLPHET